jgi:hypothetical protein
MRPKPIPALSEEQFKVVQEEMKRKPSQIDMKRIERVKEILKTHPIK